MRKSKCKAVVRQATGAFLLASNVAAGRLIFVLLAWVALEQALNLFFFPPNLRFYREVKAGHITLIFLYYWATLMAIDAWKKKGSMPAGLANVFDNERIVLVVIAGVLCALLAVLEFIKAQG